MEAWQRACVIRNLPRLLTDTFCSSYFLSLLQSKGILHKSDLDILDATCSSRGRHEQSKQLYEILMTRSRGFEEVTIALHQSNQSGARNILLFGYIEHGKYPPFPFAESILDWKSNTFPLHNEILSKYVTVQGRRRLLSDVCKTIETQCLKTIMERTIDKKVFFQVMNNENDFDLITNTTPDMPCIYIPRKLTKRNRLREGILRENCSDIFLIKGIKFDELSSRVSPALLDISRNQLEKVTARHIICEFDDDFDIICNANPSSNIHLLEFRNGRLNWIRSQGDIALLQDNICEEQSSIDDIKLVECLVKTSDDKVPICISDTPGMGKSVLLTHIANKINETVPNTLTFFFGLREFMQHAPTKISGITVKTIKELIASQTTTTIFGKEIVLNLIDSEHQRIEICFDGFDEILDAQIPTTKHLLTLIKTEFINTRLLVSTRPHMWQELERTLGVIAYTIQPLPESDQIKYLSTYWKFTLQLNSQNLEALEKFAKLCLRTLKQNMARDEGDIAGVPLQCRLLGEIYKDQAKRRLKSPDSDCAPLVTSIYQMYSKLMEQRFRRAEEQQKIKDSTHLGTGKFIRLLTGTKPWTQTIKEVHYLAAIDLLFPEFTPTVKVILPIDHHKYLFRREIYNIGLIEKVVKPNSSYKFGHITFAEFLAAEFFFNAMTNRFLISDEYPFWKSFLYFLFHKIFKSHSKSEMILRYKVAGFATTLSLHRFDKSVITYFINGHLQNNPFEKPDLVDLYQNLISMNFDDKMFYHAFVSCAVSNLEYLINLLLTLYNAKKGQRLDLPIELFIAAAKFSEYEINILLHNVFDYSSTRTTALINNIPTPCHVAIQRGNYRIFQVVLNRYQPDIGNSMLHVCLAGSKFDTTYTINQKIEIINLLLRHSPDLLDEIAVHDKSTPILQHDSHLDLIRLLLKKGAQVNTISINNETILHRFFQGNHPSKMEVGRSEEFLGLIKQFRFSGYNVANSIEEIPLSIAFRSCHIGKGILDFFERERMDFSFLNKSGENLLFTAIENNQSMECLEQLKMFGVDILAVNHSRQTLLHKAAEIGHHDAVSFLLAETTRLVDSRDTDGNTPLHLAFSKDHSRIQNLLIKAGANLLDQNQNGYAPIEYGIEQASSLTLTVEKLKILAKLGYQMSTTNADKLLRAIMMNSSAIGWNISAKLFALVGHLISAGGRVKCGDGSDPYNNIQVKLCISRIATNIRSKYNPSYSKNEPHLIFRSIVDGELKDKYKRQINKLPCDDASMEFIILVLLGLKERTLFRLLQKTYQVIQSKLRFTSSELAKFFHATNGILFVIYTDCLPLTIAKVQEQIDPSVLVVDLAAFINNIEDIIGDVVVVMSESTPIQSLLKFKDFTHRLIFIQRRSPQTNSIVTLENIEVFDDSYKWEAISDWLQEEMLAKFKGICRENDVENLDVHEILNSDTIPINFFIPNHVQNLLAGLLDEDISNISISPISTSMQNRALKYLLPQTKTHSTFQTVAAPDRCGDFLLHGPSSSYLVALWILKNHNLATSSATPLFEEIFGSYNYSIDIVNPADKQTITIKTYEFKYWLIMYFLDKLLQKCRVSNNALVSTQFEERFLHCCINQRAPNLLNLFKNKFQLHQETLLLAAKRGNVHLFSSVNCSLKYDNGSREVFKTSCYLALHELHLDDIAYFASITDKGNMTDVEQRKEIVNLVVNNIVGHETQNQKRWLTALKLLF